MLKLLKLFYKYYLNGHSENSPVKQSDFPIYIENFDFEKYRKEIFYFQNKCSIEIAKIIEYKKEIFEIFRIETKNNQAKKKMLVLATVHGNEFATALVIPRFLNDIVTNPDFYKEWQIRIIAPVNPVGLKYQSRYNKDGYDINRDFKNFQTDEAKLQRDEINIFKPDVLVSLHEDPRNGFMFFCTDKVPKQLQRKILTALKDKNILLRTNPFFIKTPESELGVTRLGIFIKTFMFVFGIYSLGRYTQTKGIADITSESYWNEKDVEKRIFPHILVLQTVVSEYTQSYEKRI